MSVDEQAEVVRTFVSGVVERFGYTAETVVRIEEEQIFVDVTGAELGLLIGPRGVTLDALQDRKLIKRGAKHKESGSYHYLISSAGKKHVESQPPGTSSETTPTANP